MKHHRKKQKRILTDCGRGIWYRINLKTDHELRAIFNKVNFIDWSHYDYHIYLKEAIICKNTGDIIYVKVFANIFDGLDHETQFKQYKICEVLDKNLSHHEIHMLKYIKKRYRIPYALTHKTIMKLVIKQKGNAQICEVMKETEIGNFFQQFLNLPRDLQFNIFKLL